jgi:mRNA-degrading endonuclease RelE of RelBE toxin-antitoxin system
MDHIFHPRAVQDARKIEQDYAEISKNLADRFWTELNEAIDAVFSRPEQHFDPSGYRRRNLGKFPFRILFEVRLDCVRIMIIRHHHRKISYGMQRR